MHVRSPRRQRRGVLVIEPRHFVRVDFEKAGEMEITLPNRMLYGIPMVKSGVGELQFTTISFSDTTNTVLVTLPEGSTSIGILWCINSPVFPNWSHSCCGASFGSGCTNMVRLFQRHAAKFSRPLTLFPSFLC